MRKKKKLKQCKPIENLAACRLPKIDVEEHRSKVKAYLKGFNKAILKAIKDDELVVRIQCTDTMEHPIMSRSMNHVVYDHTISFIDNSFIHIK